jgi:hypothetical protein
MPYKDPEKKRERARQRAREWYAANPERAKAASRAYRAANREDRKEYDRAYRAAHREEIRMKIREWHKTHPEKVQEYRQRARSKVPLEAAIESYLRERIDVLGGLCMKFIDPGQRGAPDRLVVLPNKPTFYVEVKRPRYGRLGAHQIRYHQRLRDRGQRVWALWTKEEVDAFITEVTLA